jgi:hypothetical protein
MKSTEGHVSFCRGILETLGSLASILACSEKAAPIRRQAEFGNAISQGSGKGHRVHAAYCFSKERQVVSFMSKWK